MKNWGQNFSRSLSTLPSVFPFSFILFKFLLTIKLEKCVGNLIGRSTRGQSFFDYECASLSSVATV